ncbi:MAG: hypothetical protein QXH42_06370 [Thermoplasmata archaeon]
MREPLVDDLTVHAGATHTDDNIELNLYRNKTQVESRDGYTGSSGGYIKISNKPVRELQTRALVEGDRPDSFPEGVGAPGAPASALGLARRGGLRKLGQGPPSHWVEGTM